jgi:hypothetical protein
MVGMLVEDAVSVHVGRLVHVDQHWLSPLIHSADHPSESVRHCSIPFPLRRKVIDSAQSGSSKPLLVRNMKIQRVFVNSPVLYSIF